MGSSTNQQAGACGGIWSFGVLQHFIPLGHYLHLFCVGIYLATCWFSSSWCFLSHTRGELAAVLTLFFHFPSTEKEKRGRLPLGNWQALLVSQALVHLPSIPSVCFSARLLSSRYAENIQQLLHTRTGNINLPRNQGVRRWPHKIQGRTGNCGLARCAQLIANHTGNSSQQSHSRTYTKIPI